VSCHDTLEGHWDCGYQVGRLFQSRIADAFGGDASLQTLVSAIRGNQTIKALFNSLVSLAQKRFPLYVAELNGTAAGADQAFDLVLAANFRQELATGLAVKNARAPYVAVPDACTDVYLTNPNITAWAHNEDYATVMFNTIYFVRQRTIRADGSVDQFSSFTYPGVLPGWAPGWNSHQLGISWNVLSPSDMQTAGGTAVAFVCRDVLEARSIEDAIARATPADLALGQNLNVGSFADGRIVTVEIAPGGVSDVLPIKYGAPTEFHANEYLRLKNVPQFAANIVSAQHRRVAFQSMHPPRDFSSLVAVLGDVRDQQYPIFRRNDVLDEDTLFTVAFDLTNKAITVYRDNPRRGQEAVLWSELMGPDPHTQNEVVV
jgi:hypothetical protein